MRYGLKQLVVVGAFPVLWGMVAAQNAEMTDLLNRVNTARNAGCVCQKNGALLKGGPLTWEPRLAEAARKHAQFLSTKNILSHKGARGSSPSDRVDKEQYAWRTVGENVAAGQKSVSDVFTDWLESPGHCQNMLNSDFEQYGAARVGNVWVQVFASPGKPALATKRRKRR